MAIEEGVIISRMEYRHATHRLDVWFMHGARRRFAVPPDLFEQLLSAPVKGAFFEQHIQHRGES